MPQVQLNRLDPDKFYLFTDGSCLGNPGPGGFAALLVINDTIARMTSGSEPSTTNNEMELTAIAQGLTIVEEPAVVVTDSRYCQMGITTWSLSWKSNNWRKSNKKPIKNLSLWQTIDENRDKISRIIRVAGHSGVKYNELADKLAHQQAVEEQRQ